jgi:Ni,Fe-hydrogenase III large subunit
MINKLMSFFNQAGIQTNEHDDSLIAKLSLTTLNQTAVFLKEHHANFEALVAGKEQDLLLRYFFYIGVKNKILILELPASTEAGFTQFTHRTTAFGLGQGVCERANNAEISQVRKSCEDQIPSLTALYPAVYRYEQDLSDKYGFQFSGSAPYKVPARAVDELREAPNLSEQTIIPVGPVHAGVIEPGHFHFTTLGEHIINLDISLGYLHKGLLSEFEHRSISEGLDLSQEICGDSLVAYSWAFAHAVEKAYDITPSKTILFSRMIALELERLYNHMGDIGGIINDTGFALANAYLSIIKEKILRLNERLFGHRFLKHFIKIANTTKKLSKENLTILSSELSAREQEFEKLLVLTSKHSTVLERLNRTGILSHQKANFYSVLGVVGKASGISFDSRRDMNFAAYEDIKFQSHLRREGDVFARLQLRISEVKESFHIIYQCVNKLANIQESDAAPIELTKLKRPFSWAMVEAARGPVFVYVELNEQGLIKQVLFRDISRHNWKVLEEAVLGNIVPDFPLCNKSFSLSYAGTDL